MEKELRFYLLLLDIVKYEGDFSMFCPKLPQEAKGTLKIVEFKEVTHANIVFVKYDVIATMSTDNLEKLEEFVSESVRNIPNFLVTSTIINSREYKTNAVLKVNILFSVRLF
jgi:DNA-binding Lrp family transcriptional regulator